MGPGAHLPEAVQTSFSGETFSGSPSASWTLGLRVIFLLTAPLVLNSPSSGGQCNHFSLGRLVN